jgi:carboxypeptidase PM20D1
LDVKNGVVGLLEAASALLAEGYSPRRTLMFAFGQDEEVGGDAGAAQIAGV